MVIHSPINFFEFHSLVLTNGHFGQPNPLYCIVIPQAYSSDQKDVDHLIGQVHCAQAIVDILNLRSSRPQGSSARSRLQVNISQA